MWESWLNQISDSVKRVATVKTNMRQPGPDLSNRSPELIIEWDAAKVGISGADLYKLALEGEPRVMLDRTTANSVAIVPYQMQPGEEKVVAERLYALLSAPPKVAPPPPPPTGEPVAVAGMWEVKLQFVGGSASHKVMFEQNGGRLQGTHEGEFASGDLSGTVAGNRVQFRSSLPTDGTRVSFQFEGTEQDGKLAGKVLLGEYGEAKWTAERHQFRTGGRRG